MPSTYSNRYRNRRKDLSSIQPSLSPHPTNDYHYLNDEGRVHECRESTSSSIANTNNVQSSTRQGSHMNDVIQLAHFETKSTGMMRLRHFGCMLSGLSKSNITIKHTRENRLFKSNRTKLNKIEQGIYKSKLSRINTMKRAYMRKEASEEEDEKEKNSNVTDDIKPYNKERTMINHDMDYSKQKIVSDDVESIVIENDKSMSELIDWLENVDLNSIHDFV